LPVVYVAEQHEAAVTRREQRADQVPRGQAPELCTLRAVVDVVGNQEVGLRVAGRKVEIERVNVPICCTNIVFAKGLHPLVSVANL
jgi:hypothetical protein